MLFDEGDVHRALEADEFLPYFQPIVELRTGQLAGFEVLARWTHVRLGTIPPDDFIPIVERSGLINTLTQRILEKTFAASPLLPDSLVLSVNLSPTQLLDFTLPAQVAAAAARGSFPLDRLTIEITESALLEDLPRAQAVARELKALHCRLALDDFGTGYSSMTHLQALPLDELKVDRSFVGSMTETRESRKIVAAVVGLGQSLGLRTVGEGVESQEQANMLLWLGCDLGQGWLYGRPAPADEIPRMVEAARRANFSSMPVSARVDSIMNLDAFPAQRLAQLQAIYDGAPVGLCFLDRNMRYVSINRRLAQINGAPIAAHLGRTPAELIPLVYPKVESYILRALQGEAIAGVEVQKPVADINGPSQTILLSYQPAFDEAGEVLGVSVAMMDITERKRVEQALRENEEHSRRMVELNPHVMWVLDAQGKVIEAGPGWEQITGMALKDALGDGWLRALHPDDITPTVQAIEDTLRTGHPIDIEYRVHCRDGAWKSMRSRGSPSFGPAREVVRVYGSVEDIGAHKRAEEALREFEDLTDALLDALPVGVVIANAPDGRIVAANPESARILDNAALLGMTMEDYGRLSMRWPDGHALEPEDYPLARAVLRGETTGSEEVTCHRENGDMARVSLSAKPIYAHDGHRIGAAMFLQEMAAERLERVP